MAESVNPALFEEGIEAFSFFGSETWAFVLALGVVNIDFFVDDVKVTAPDYRFFLFEFC